MTPTVRTIQQVTARKFKIPAYSMTEPSNRGQGHNGRNAFKFSRPRQVAMFIASELTTKSKSQIGTLFGGRDHTTVLHAIHEVAERIKNDKVLRLRIETIKHALKAVDNAPPFACVRPPLESLKCPMVEQKPKRDWRAEERAELKAWVGNFHDLFKGQAFEPKVREEDRVRRDPCIKCGTRADIGCVHTRVAA